MARLTVPTKLEDSLALSDGSQGTNIKEALSYKPSQVDNLYSWDSVTQQFKLSFQEKGVAYNETEPSQQLAETTLTNLSGTSNFQLTFHSSPVEKWGINFVGVVSVEHKSGPTRTIYIPGTRTYDPAGMSGDPHASERIGPSCSRTQVGITLAELVAVYNGATMGQLDKLQEVLRPLIVRYHGRVPLFDWMCLQIQEATIENKDVTPYPEYLKSLIRTNKLQLDERRDHTRSYLQSYNKGQATPPVQYYKKVNAKDKINDILSEEQLATFKSIIQ